MSISIPQCAQTLYKNKMSYLCLALTLVWLERTKNDPLVFSDRRQIFMFLKTSTDLGEQTFTLFVGLIDPRRKPFSIQLQIWQTNSN